MKIIDEYFGKVIAYLISFHKKHFPRENSDSDSYKNILFIKFWGIGSIVLTIPSLVKIKSDHPDSKIFFLTLKNNSEICKEIKLIDETITISISNPITFISDLTNKLLYLRKMNFKIIYDFEFYTYFSAIMAGLLKSESTIGFDNLKSSRRNLFSHTVLFNTNIHTKDNFLNLVNEGKSENNASYNFKNIFDNHTAFNKNGVPSIIVNPNASKLAYERRLPKETFIKIINHLTKNFKCKILITGAKDEMNYIESIYQQLQNKDLVDNICGRTTVKELIELINSSVCLITNDSGPLHIASALDVPVIAFFGPESPQRYGPLSERSLVFYNELPCSPCMSISNLKTVNCIYDSPMCMEQFDTKNVFHKIDLFLNDVLDLNKRIVLEKTENIF